MQLTEVRINLAEGEANRLKAFCSLTFDDTFVIRDVKLIDGNEGLFLAMPSRKLMDRCPRCSEKNHLRARFCNQCGSRLNENRCITNHRGPSRPKLHADIAHPINVSCREDIEKRVFTAYREEIRLSQLPGYIPKSLDMDEAEFYHHATAQTAVGLHS